tara:strand:+ start:60 stop:926 length:867 start_codon:yes stop_codon:yes gene_type:complete
MEEKQYLNLISNIIDNGSVETGRNGDTIVLFGTNMRFSLTNSVVPFITTKKLAWKTCLKELLWFISGKTDNKILKQQKVNIWNANGTREFLDSRNLDYPEDDLGPVYGHQWRFFNAEYKGCDENYNNKGVDQLQNIINILKNPKERSSRRIILSAWNPCQLDEMALPPCHVLMQLHVSNNNELSCILYQRSGDIGLGVPFNIASYSLLTHLLAHHCDLKPKEFIHFIGNTHIYKDHIDPLKTQISREPFDFPTLDIKNKYDNINDYKFDDFIINNYVSHDKIPMNMSA